MEANERVKYIRKQKNLTQEKFGSILGVKNAAINKIETGNVRLTDQMAKAICREFHVSYDWLVNGGDVENAFANIQSDALDDFLDAYDCDQWTRDFIRALLKMPKDIRAPFMQELKNIL